VSKRSAAHGEGEYWRGSAGSRKLAAVLSVLTIAVAVFVVLESNWPLIGLVVAMAIAGSLSFWFVEINEHEVEIRSTYAWPRISVATADIDSAAVVDVRPLRDWAGCGLRFNGMGDSAVVLRSGAGLSINRKGGRRTVITARNSEQAADFLNRLLERDRR